MSLTLNMVGGGGQGEGPIEGGTIAVKYPAGATCTVTNGSDTYTALDTSGAAAFVVEPGTWTVTATDGVFDRSKTVEITATGQMVYVELIFELRIFKAGSGALIPLSMSKQRNSTTSIGNNAISFTNNGNTGYNVSMVFSNDSYDITPYTELEIAYTGSGNSYSLAGLLKNKPTEGTVDQLSESWVASGFKTKIDVSSITGKYYIGFKGQKDFNITEATLR